MREALRAAYSSSVSTPCQVFITKYTRGGRYHTYKSCNNQRRYDIRAPSCAFHVIKIILNFIWERGRGM